MLIGVEKSAASVTNYSREVLEYTFASIGGWKLFKATEFYGTERIVGRHLIGGEMHAFLPLRTELRQSGDAKPESEGTGKITVKNQPRLSV
jgi:hypothetical protein